ncbi:MAG: 4-vinyl reductase [Elusimicrobia bacterium]|nr:4-vinyl reductase [Elusimicrobiota bacterium]
MTKTTTKTTARAKAVPRGLELIGHPAEGRPTLGPTIPVDLFRALRLIGVMEGLEDTIGKESASLVYSSGKYLGYGLGKAIMEQTGRDLTRYAEALTAKLKELGVGLLSILELKLDEGIVRFQVDECVTCAGMPVVGRAVCHFEAGFIGGLMEVFLGGGRKCHVKETKCNGMGDGTCEFEVRIKQG